MTAFKTPKGRRKLRAIVRNRQNGHCALCGADWTGKHLHLLRVVDDAQGGIKHPDNVLGACDNCAEAKSKGRWGSPTSHAANLIQTDYPTSKAGETR